MDVGLSFTMERVLGTALMFDDVRTSMDGSIAKLIAWNEPTSCAEVIDQAAVRLGVGVASTTVCWRLIDNGQSSIYRELNVTRTLPVAEAVHRALVALAGNGQAVNCPELIGQDRFGQPLSGRHEHAKILPLDLDGDQVLDHVLLHAPMGLGQLAERAVLALNLLRVGSGALVRLELLTRDKSGRALVQRFLPSIQGAKVWSSVTPYVPPRFLKKSGKNSLFGQVQTELATRGFPAPIVCEVVPQASASMRNFVRSRSEGKLGPPQNVGFALKLQFAQAVMGPVALGYASHFGLGWMAVEG